MSNFIVRSSELYHVGNKNSGRYPRGSGERPYQHGGYQSKKRIRNDIESMNESTRDKLTKLMSSDTYKHANSKLKQYITDVETDITPYINDTRSELKSLNKEQLYVRLNRAIEADSKIHDAAITFHVYGVNKRWDDIATQHNIPTDVKNAIKNATHDGYFGNSYSDLDTHTVAKFLNTLPVESHNDKFWSYVEAADPNGWIAYDLPDSVYFSKYINKDAYFDYIDGWIR